MIDISLEEEVKVHGGVNLKILGIGGAGGNAVNSMIKSNEFDAVQFLVANTDAQALAQSPARVKIQLGTKITKGLGAGSNPDIGRRSAEEDVENVINQIKDADIIFLTAGLGGGTGSGSIPVIAGIAKELGILTVAIVTKPFIFEGKRRARIADEAAETLRKVVDTIIVVPNQRLLEVVDEKISMLDAFALSNDILKQAIKGISDIITKSGHINVDFADVRAIMKDMGMALMGTGRATGVNRAKEAAAKAISSPLLENVSIKGARGVLINITGNVDLGLYEINEAASLVYDLVSEDANIILGSVIDQNMGDEIMVTVIATGFETKQEQAVIKEAPAQRMSDNRFVEQRFAHESGAVSGSYEKTYAVSQSTPARVVTPSRTDESCDLQDLDTPTYLRRKAVMQQEQDHHFHGVPAAAPRNDAYEQRQQNATEWHDEELPPTL
ncbi:cell division protein FtsZ [bacterium]|nr:MAG: cell division protein FtsZ [bacterium]